MTKVEITSLMLMNIGKKLIRSEISNDITVILQGSF